MLGDGGRMPVSVVSRSRTRRRVSRRRGGWRGRR
jgi:hypothetical protein